MTQTKPIKPLVAKVLATAIDHCQMRAHAYAIGLSRAAFHGNLVVHGNRKSAAETELQQEVACGTRRQAMATGNQVTQQFGLPISEFGVINGDAVKSQTYTPGHTQNASDFMAKRTLESHGAFFLPYLETGLSVLDCGCGPGSITMGIAARTAPGEVVGIDFAQSQIERAKAEATQRGSRNVKFETGDCYSLSFDSGKFDRVFSHALMEHLGDPVRALRELCRILKAGGVIGVCSPDWSGFILSPPAPELSRAVEAYMALQSKNGGDVGVGRKLGVHLAAAGFDVTQISARYECYSSLEFIGEYLASQLEREGDRQSATVFREWSRQNGGLFAQAWVSAIGVKPQ